VCPLVSFLEALFFGRRRSNRREWWCYCCVHQNAALLLSVVRRVARPRRECQDDEHADRQKRRRPHHHLSLSKRFRCSLGENEWSAVARSLSLSLFSTPQRKRRPTKDTRRALNTKRQNDEGLFASSSFSLRGILFAAFPKATKKKKKKKNEEKSVKK
jgi:hypothetical protein